MWLIRTKLEAPSPTERLIARQRLRRRLSAVLRARLALIHAPAGFGKTCLLAEWQRCLAAQRVRTAWLSLDEDDSEPLQFMAYLTAALDAAGIEVGHLRPAAERGFPDVPISSLIAALNHAIQRSGRPPDGCDVSLLLDTLLDSVGLFRQSFIPARSCFVVLPKRVQNVPQVEVRLGELRIACERIVVSSGRILEPHCRLQGDTEVVRQFR